MQASNPALPMTDNTDEAVRVATRLNPMASPSPLQAEPVRIPERTEVGPARFENHVKLTRRSLDGNISGTLPRRRTDLRHSLLHFTPMTWAYCDILVVLSATTIAHQIVVSGSTMYSWAVGPWLSASAFAGGITLAGLVFGLYESQTLNTRSRLLVRSSVTLAIGLILGYAFIYLFCYGHTTRWLGLYVAGGYAGIAVPLRLLAHEVVTNLRVNVLCLGNGCSIQKIVSLVKDRARPHHNIVGYLEVPASANEAGMVGCERRAIRSHLMGQLDSNFVRACPRLGMISDLTHVLKEYAVDEIVVDAALTAHDSVGAAVLACLDYRCRVTDQPTFVEKFLDEVPAENINTQWFLVADLQKMSGYEAVKRMTDIILATIGFVLTLPFWPLIALAIRLDSRGPIFYKQIRVGLHGRQFSIFKFRTMRQNAEKDGAQWASTNDSRITRIGRLLRKTRLDELPQLWNILRGEMSLVGPRPERPEFVEQLSELIPHYRQRHLIKPGLTGWAQIRYSYGASVEDAHRKLCYDLYYLKNRSIDLDAAIVIRTVGRFLLGAH